MESVVQQNHKYYSSITFSHPLPPIHSGQPQNEREIKVVLNYVQTIETFHIRCK